MNDWNPGIQRNLSIQYIFTLLGELLAHTLNSAPCWIPVLYLLSQFLHLLAFNAVFLPSRICQMLCITTTLNNFMENQQFMGHGYGNSFQGWFMASQWSKTRLCFLTSWWIFPKFAGPKTAWLSFRIAAQAWSSKDVQKVKFNFLATSKPER